MRTRKAAWAVCAVLVAGAVAACGGSSGNGVSAKSANDIVTASANAIDGVSSLHVAGAVISSGSPITLNLSLVANQGGEGTMSQNGLSFQIISVDQTVYLNGSPACWQHFGGAAAAQLFNGKWLKAPATG